MPRLFNAEDGVHPGSEYHVLSEWDLREMNLKMEELGNDSACTVMDDIMRSRSRQATRYEARRVIGRGYPDAPRSAWGLDAFPTIHSGHFANMIGEVLEDLGEYEGKKVTGARLYISRMKVADGAPCNNCVELEFKMGGSWIRVSPRD